MKTWIKNLFSENSQVSCTRVMAMIGLLTSIALAWNGKPGFEVFLYTSLGSKVIQKFAEVKEK